MVCAVDSSPTSGRGQPAAIGTSRMPAIVATTSALRVTLSSVELPITVVIASSSISGLPWASSRAMASSWPGSQSRMIFLGTSPTLAAPACRLDGAQPGRVARSREESRPATVSTRIEPITTASGAVHSPDASCTTPRTNGPVAATV